MGTIPNQRSHWVVIVEVPVATNKTYWGDSNDQDGFCACGVEGNCAGGNLCNCDAGDRLRRIDEGLLTIKEDLPVQALYFRGRLSKHTLGVLTCMVNDE